MSEDDSFEFIKEQIKEQKINSLDCDVLSTFCAKLQLKTSGTKEALIERLSPLQDDAMIEKRITLIGKKFKFPTSLLRESVPPATAGWKFDVSLFPKIGQAEIDAHQSHKRQGRKGQHRKAYRMFQSQRMKLIKAIQGEGISVGSLETIKPTEPVGSFETIQSSEPVGSFEAIQSTEQVGSFEAIQSSEQLGHLKHLAHCNQFGHLRQFSHLSRLGHLRQFSHLSRLGHLRQFSHLSRLGHLRQFSDLSWVI